MLANDLADKLRSLNLTGAPVVRVASLSSDQEVGIVVKTPLDGMKIDPEMPGYVTGAVQIIVRHRDPLAGNALAEEITRKLTVIGQPMDLENYRLKQFTATTEPVMFPINLAALYEFSVNFQCYAIRR